MTFIRMILSQRSLEHLNPTAAKAPLKKVSAFGHLSNTDPHSGQNINPFVLWTHL